MDENVLNRIYIWLINAIKCLRIEKEEKMQKFKIGDGVSVISGPMKGLYGVIVYFYEEKGEYLVRFTGQQQLYYTEDQIQLWEK